MGGVRRVGARDDRDRVRAERSPDDERVGPGLGDRLRRRALPRRHPARRAGDHRRISRSGLCREQAPPALLPRGATRLRRRAGRTGPPRGAALAAGALRSRIAT